MSYSALYMQNSHFEALSSRSDYLSHSPFSPANGLHATSHLFHHAHFYSPYSLSSPPNGIISYGGVDSGNSGAAVHEPNFVRKRNERERQRVKCVNEGYARLRDHLPADLAEKRLSKVETLRAAIKYIHYLETILNDSSTPANLKSDDLSSISSQHSDSEKENVDIRVTSSSVNSPNISSDSALSPSSPCSEQTL